MTTAALVSPRADVRIAPAAEAASVFSLARLDRPVSDAEPRPAGRAQRTRGPARAGASQRAVVRTVVVAGDAGQSRARRTALLKAACGEGPIDLVLRDFHASLAVLGAVLLQARDFARPEEVLTPENAWAAGGRLIVSARSRWVDGPAYRHAFAECSAITDIVRSGATSAWLGGMAPVDDPAYDSLWAALAEGGVHDLLAVSVFGDAGRITTVHVGFARRILAAMDVEDVELAALVFAQRLSRTPAPVPAAVDCALTAREVAALRLVADGKADGEIAAILEVSVHTARFHVDNARRKLDAVSRAQAVARLAAIGRL